MFYYLQPITQNKNLYTFPQFTVYQFKIEKKVFLLAVKYFRKDKFLHLHRYKIYISFSLLDKENCVKTNAKTDKEIISVLL